MARFWKSWEYASQLHPPPPPADEMLSSTVALNSESYVGTRKLTSRVSEELGRISNGRDRGSPSRLVIAKNSASPSTAISSALTVASFTLSTTTMASTMGEPAATDPNSTELGVAWTPTISASSAHPSAVAIRMAVNSSDAKRFQRARADIRNLPATGPRARAQIRVVS